MYVYVDGQNTQRESRPAPGATVTTVCLANLVISNKSQHRI